MKSTTILLSCLLITSSIAMNMDMDMDMSSAETNHDSIEPSHTHNHYSDDKSNKTDTSNQLEPTPHVMKHQHGLPILQTHLLPEERLFWENYNTTTYFNIKTNHRPSLYLHIIFGLISIFILYPLTLIFNNLNLSKTYLVSLIIHTSCLIFSIFNYSIFINSIPDLYPGNAYNKMIIIVFISTILQLILAFIKNLETNTNSNSTIHSSNRYFNLSTSTSSSDDESSSIDSTPTNYEKVFNKEESKLSKLQNKMKLNKLREWISNTKVFYAIKIAFNLLNWGHFFYFFVLVPTGVATFCLYGKEQTVFNLLAHFIKGGVFFAYGVLSLARYSGAFSQKGWSWNHKFITNDSQMNYWEKFQNKGLWTMEMIESSLILFYGSTNIFLEHLSNAGEEWSPKDLQHVSIAFIFIGCGLCGVITELKLQDWRFEQAKSNYQKFITTTEEDHPQHHQVEIIKASPGFSPNPFPILTIYWTGILMSKHQQASELSTEIHVQWGNLFIMGCCFRFLTYILMLLIKKNSTTELIKPNRPITELIVSFCLLCGGIIFMESTDPIILSFEYYGLTSMFTLNVTLGFITLFMSYMMSLFVFKDWLKNKSSTTEVV
ncbi:uncharacterized protein KGF55_001897 [Candida pseudojiufengensis]|uniref:uncharacterized protein n=1 Tax=Candida pseudojiufengensis TaxID=497109 RepID=UPI00222563EB|nr:uncharacterized protein KGF55_001897 [Candida pseudojiufengensis]KAI5964827.1 hypothetical protein KGF55_001897 [Candida pseudojiufengensis]